MKRTGTDFTKPYGKELLGSDRVVHYAYPREELTREDIFPYLVLDGGASQLMLDRFGSNSGERLLDLTMSGELFDEFRSGGEYSWERSFAYTDGTDFRKKYEWQIWPQRLYMTIPVAHAFLRTGEERYARRWLEIVKGWHAAHPYQPFDPEVHYLETDMVWRDMQVAWRTMSLLHGIFMLEDAPFLREDWEYLYDLVRLHANHLYEEAEDRIRRGLAQNHVLQIGVVLIMTAVMFPELERSRELLAIGIDTVRMNMKAIHPDGASDEDSPSYSHFIARLYLEAFLLLNNNGEEIPEGLYESILTQYEWLHQFSTPTGGVVRFSDSYAMDAAADIERARRLIPFEPQELASRRFTDSRTAVIRAHGFTLFADAMPYTGGHQHAGRPQIELYYGEEPLVTDAGCCSYDRWELYFHLRDMRQHNVLFSPALVYADGRIDMNPSIIGFDPAGRITLGATVTEGEVKYTWTRTVTVSEGEVIITDEASADTSLPWEVRLFTPRADVYKRDAHTTERLTEHSHISITTSLPHENMLIPVMNGENRIDYAIVPTVKANGKSVKLETVIRVEKSK